MAKPLRSDNPAPQSVQFSHFGVLNDGKQSKAAFTTSIVTNLIAAALIIIIGSVVRTNVTVAKPKDISFVEPIKETPPPKPPPVKLPPPPKIKVPEPPKIKMPEPKVPEIKPEVKMAVAPVHIAAAPPTRVNPPPAPVKVDLSNKAASVKNNDLHPSPIRLGTPDNPLKPLTGPAVSRVNLGGAGAPGMPPGNTGSGPRATAVNMGSGSPYGKDVNGNTAGVRPVEGVKLGGVTNGTGHTPGTGSAVAVNIPGASVQPARPVPTVQSVSAGTPPKLLSKPAAVYTDEAKNLHLEGSVTVHIRVTASGSVQVLGVTHGLGHGLDQQALRVAEGMRFTPAKDGSGNPRDWEGDIRVNFQLAG
jgi:protein TonB